MYKQTDGVAMGSPLGPVLANIFMGYCEDRISKEHMPLFYNRYVDDTFAFFRSSHEAHEFHQILNSIHPSLKFTREDEEEDKLAFLDINISRKGQQLLRSIYRKKTFTGLYIRYDSFCPRHHKLATIKSLASRAKRICTP